MVESDKGAEGRLVIADGIEFVLDDTVVNMSSGMGNLHIDFVSEGYRKGFVVYFGR